MKWLFSILLIANLGMFIWLFPQRDGVSTSALQVEDIGELRLVGELEDDASAGAEDVLAQAQSLPDAVEAEEQIPPLVMTPEEVPRTPPNVEPEAAASPDTATLVSSSETPQTPAAPACGRVGAFDKRTQAELLSVRMLAQGAKTEITSESSNEQAGFWVLIPPQKDRKAAIEISKRLEAAGVSDLWRFTSGGLAHAISLGLFRDRDRAQARRDLIAEMGFDAEVRPRYREQTRYWLDYRFTGDTPLSEVRWQEISKQHPDVQRQEQPCPY
jgi:hypothetical protein